MAQTVVVHGHLNDPRHIELDEPVVEISEPVEVAIRSIAKTSRVPLFESSTVEDWEREFHAWIDGHDHTTEVPSAEAITL